MEGKKETTQAPENLDNALQLSDRLDVQLKIIEDQAARIVALEAAIIQHAARFAALEAIVEPLLDAPQERSAKPPKSEGVTLRGDVFTVKNKKYRLRLAQFSHKGRTVTEDDLLADVALQKELVEEGLGVIEAV